MPDREVSAVVSGNGLRILALVTDAHGGFGGISQYNRDVLAALCGFDTVAEVHVLTRVPPEVVPGDLHPKLRYSHDGAGAPTRYSLRSLMYGLRMGKIDLVYCAHINLVPVAAAIAQIKRAPLVLSVYGMDVWKPSGRLPQSLLKQVVSSVVSISEITLNRFREWCDYPKDRAFLVPNAIVPSDYGAGRKMRLCWRATACMARPC